MSAKPANAYQAAQVVRGKLEAELLKIKGSEKAIKLLEELGELYAQCIPDSDKESDEQDHH